jgi:excisionase family DNA binding protein
MNNTENIMLKARDVAVRLNVSRAMAYKLMKDGSIQTVHFGGSIRVRQTDLEEFILRSLVKPWSVR